MDFFTTWMFKEGTYNDMVVYFGVFVAIALVCMVYNYFDDNK